MEQNQDRQKPAGGLEDRPKDRRSASIETSKGTNTANGSMPNLNEPYYNLMDPQQRDDDNLSQYVVGDPSDFRFARETDLRPPDPGTDSDWRVPEEELKLLGEEIEATGSHRDRQPVANKIPEIDETET